MAFLNEQGLERLWLHIIAKLGNKVDRVDGKGLSTNDYTTEEKNKLANIENVIFEQVENDYATKNYADNAAATIKNELLNGAEPAYDTLKELSVLINENTNALDALENVAIGKKDSDLIVTYLDGSTFSVTHSSEEIYEEINKGRTVKFRKDTELLDVLEATQDYITFYMTYVNMNGKLQQKIIVIGGSSIMLEQDDTYDYAVANHNHDNKYSPVSHNHDDRYYTESEIDTKLSELGQGTQVQIITWGADD